MKKHSHAQHGKEFSREKLKDYLTRLDYGSKSRVLEKNEQLVGANFSVPKIVLKKIGGLMKIYTIIMAMKDGLKKK